MLKEQVQNDVKNALKSGDAQKRLVLSGLLSAVQNKEFEKRTKLSRSEQDVKKLEEGSKLTDEEIIDVVASEVKKRKESIESYEKGGRPELAEKEQAELQVLMAYLPEQMPEDAVRAEVKKAIADIGASGVKDMGKVIGAVMAKVKGRVEGGVVSRIVKEELAP